MKNKLDKIKIKQLSKQESDQAWRFIRSQMPEAKPQFWSVLTSLPVLLKPRLALSTLMVVLLVLGGSIASVKAADNARPGDFLFPLDRAIEEIQIKLVSKEKGLKLQLEFAKERVDEVKEIMIEAQVDSNDSEDQTQANLLSDSNNTQLQQALGILMITVSATVISWI